MNTESDNSKQALLVDDNATNIALASALLKKFGFVVATALDGSKAIDESKRQRFDIILMDCLMPLMDGYEATRGIRADPGNPNTGTPIIALTGNASEDDRDLCIASGMSDYLEKPLRPANLTDMLKKWAGYGV
ncbi:MAG: response regulator [Symploca sp. SIO2D2]|nr:response regulator [Symploca sp. SIO2D2]